jgi:cell shape-determining protein MreC
MKRILIVVGFCIILIAGIGFWSQSRAQQPAADTRIETYKFLLSEANDRLANANAQIALHQQDVTQLRTENTKLKADLEKATGAKKE